MEAVPEIRQETLLSLEEGLSEGEEEFSSLSETLDLSMQGSVTRHSVWCSICGFLGGPCVMHTQGVQALEHDLEGLPLRGLHV